MGGRSAECPGPHGDQAGGWYSELNGRGGLESAGGCVGVQEFTNVWRGEVVEGLEGEEQNLEVDAGFDRDIKHFQKWKIKVNNKVLVLNFMSLTGSSSIASCFSGKFVSIYFEFTNAQHYSHSDCLNPLHFVKVTGYFYFNLFLQRLHPPLLNLCKSLCIFEWVP